MSKKLWKRNQRKKQLKLKVNYNFKFFCHFLILFLIKNKIKILVQMHSNKEKALADAAFYKALKEIESNKVNFFKLKLKFFILTKS